LQLADGEADHERDQRVNHTARQAKVVRYVHTVQGKSNDGRRGKDWEAVADEPRTMSVISSFKTEQRYA
jgi:hypothetical protein